MQLRTSGPIAASIASMSAAQDLEISVRVLSTHFNRYLITYDKEYLEPVPAIQQRVAAALLRAEEAATSPAEHAQMIRIRSGYQRFSTSYEKMIQKAPKEGVYNIISKEIDPILMKEILDPAHEYLRLNEGMLTQASETNRELADRLTFWLMILGLTGAIGGLLGGAVISSAIRRNQLKTEEQLHTTAEQLDRAIHADIALAKSGDGLARIATSATAVLQKLRQTERNALRAEQLAWVGQMAAGIAHEIRNPLMAIKLIVQATADRQSGSSFKSRDLEVLEEEIIRLEQIVSGFLDFARPPRLDLQPVDVRDLIERTVGNVKARAELQAVQIQIVHTPGPSVISVDPNQLRQVVYNLLFNAMDAQPQGGYITIRLMMQSGAEGIPEMQLEFADAGPGLPKELGDRIFEPFISTKETGLGLGLSICRRIVETHGGRMTAVSLPNEGSSFTLRIPAAS
ncbi:ATP-binding protein [soil metagenome]